LTQRACDYIIKEKTVLLQKKDSEGFGFVLRGAKAQTPIEEFTPTPAFPALQYLESVDEGGVAWRAGLRMGDFLIEVNGQNVVKVGHRQVVNMIRQGGNSLMVKVVMVTRNPDMEEGSRKKIPQQSKRLNTPAIALRSKSMTSELEEMDLDRHSQHSPFFILFILLSSFFCNIFFYSLQILQCPALTKFLPLPPQLHRSLHSHQLLHLVGEPSPLSSRLSPCPNLRPPLHSISPTPRPSLCTSPMVAGRGQVVPVLALEMEQWTTPHLMHMLRLSIQLKAGLLRERLPTPGNLLGLGWGLRQQVSEEATAQPSLHPALQQ
uniref:SH3 and multiple ankyrin repeat domains 1 n=1 Tax=Oryzias latipes TaxID=8090 RepID=A0A3P9HAU0_ORYLA